MAANTLQIVDSIASSPTVVLDLNNENPFGAAELDVSPPRLRYSSSSSMLRDGTRLSQSSYENRELRLTFDVISTSQDTWAASFQTLARAIDQDRFWIKYQPTGMTNPVFFNCYRASPDQVADIVGATAYRTVSLSIMADSPAYGLPEDATFTITNDPTTGTNKMMYTFGTVKGDLEAPLVLAQTTGSGVSSTTVDGVSGIQPAYLASYSVRGTTHSFMARSLTELTSGTDVGATVSAAGTAYVSGNYKQWTPTGTTMTTRLSGSFSTTLSPMPGTYRALVRIVLPSGGTLSRTLSMKLGVLAFGTYIYGDTTNVSLLQATGGDRGVLVDLGIVQLPVKADWRGAGFVAPATTSIEPDFSIQASISATGLNIRFDELYLIPVETAYGLGRLSIVSLGAAMSGTNLILYDGLAEVTPMRAVSDASGTSPFTGLPNAMPSANGIIGVLPTVQPGANNYLQWIVEDNPVGGTTAFTARYYPAYLYLRPATT